MLEIQKFAIDKIYCAPSQDRQYCFALARVNNPDFPVKRFATIYGLRKNLPNMIDAFHVFVVGNLNPTFLNLLKQKREWFKDVWINVNEDINIRNYIFQMYNSDGVVFPRQHIYYSFIDESSIAVAIPSTDNLKRHFDVKSFSYLRFYSNSYFSTDEYNSLPVKYGIKCELAFVETNTDKVALQQKIKKYELQGGKALVYVDGYITDNLNLNIANNSYVEFLYDQSIISKEKFNINSLRTFESTKDNKLKYLLFRDKIINRIQYDDDNEIYITTDNQLVTKGLYYYEHKDYSVRNVTDKDYSLYTSFVNTQVSTLARITSSSLDDKVIILYTRKSGLTRDLIYSSMKLHELYKLPQDVELNVLSNTNYTINELRAETLENSDYFSLASSKQISNISKTLSSSAVGYNGVTYYFGYTPTVLDTPDRNIQVPFLYQNPSYAFEYNSRGVMTGKFLTNGPIYSASSSDTKYVEFLKGTTPDYFNAYLPNDGTCTLRNAEYKILSAYFDNVTRISNWEDITEIRDRCSVVNNVLTVTEQSGRKVKVVYLDQPLVYDLELPIVDGVLYFPLYVNEDRGTGIQNHPIDIPYRSIEVFLNGNRLNYNLDVFINLPYALICNKTYLDYTKEKQSIHIRMHGYTLDKNDINANEIRGFVNNGVLTRNKYYDIRDDRVFSTYVQGKLKDRRNIIFSEDDNTVRLNNPYNGMPYVICEHMIPVKEVTGVDTIPLYLKNLDLNKKISDLFNLVFKEPDINTFNVIGDHHYIYSPVVSKVIHDMLDGNISPDLYTNPYDDFTIINLLDTQYKILMALDPIKTVPEDNIVVIHPHIGNTTINLNLFQFRFITNVIRILTQNKPSRINTSGYLTLTK